MFFLVNIKEVTLWAQCNRPPHCATTHGLLIIMDLYEIVALSRHDWLSFRRKFNYLLIYAMHHDLQTCICALLLSLWPHRSGHSVVHIRNPGKHWTQFSNNYWFLFFNVHECLNCLNVQLTTIGCNNKCVWIKRTIKLCSLSETIAAIHHLVFRYDCHIQISLLLIFASWFQD